MGSDIRRVDGWYSRRGPLAAGGWRALCVAVCRVCPEGAAICARVRAHLKSVRVPVLCARVGPRARRTLNRFGHVREVPDERLVVVARRADVARRVRRPGQRVDALRVALQLRRRQRGHADVQDDDTIRVHRDHRQIVRVLLIPLQPNQRHRRAALAVCALVDDRRVLQAAQVEHAHLPGAGRPAPTRGSWCT